MFEKKLQVDKFFVLHYKNLFIKKKKKKGKILIVQIADVMVETA